MPVEIRRVGDQRAAEFLAHADREGRNTLWNFAVVWHEQTHDVAALDGEETVGAARMRIAASLGNIEALIVRPDYRRSGVGRQLLLALEEVANYYNCHKMTLIVPLHSAAQAFLERCLYKVEAVLPQHTWKIDHAVMRKFLL